MICIAVCDDEQYMSDKISAMVSDFFGRKSMEHLLTSLQNDIDKKLLVQRGNDSSIISFDEIIGRKVYLHLVSAEVKPHNSDKGTIAA